MNRLGKVLVCVLVLGGMAASALAQDSLSEMKKAQNKLLAYRAARVDAMRRLAERINGLIITSETTVRDFVAESDRIQTAMMSWLNGAREVGDPSYLPDGTCEVTMEVTLQEVIVELKKLHKQYYQGNKVAYETLDQISVNTQEKVIREKGAGAPREEPAFNDRGVLAAQGAGQDIMPAGAWAYWNAHCIGRGRLMAERAAELDAMRKLSERIYGLWINSETRVQDFVAQSDRIQTSMTAFLRGARTVGVLYHTNELIVEVEKEVTLQDLIVNLQQWQQQYYTGNQVSVQDIQSLSARIEERDIRERGMGVPPEQYLKDLTPVGVSALAVAGAVNNWPPTQQAIGNAAIDTDNPNAASAKLMAFRAAELDGRRKLAEEINGLMITSNTSVADFVAQDDRIRTAMMTFQQGAHRIDGSEKVLPDGTVQVAVEIDLQPLWNMILYYQETMSLTIR